MENVVQFLVGLQAEYDALKEKNPNTLYFTSDTHCIYRGDVLFASGLLENLEQDSNFEIYGGSALDVLEEEGE